VIRAICSLRYWSSPHRRPSLRTRRSLQPDLNVRTALAFKVPDGVVQKLLPSGFQLNSPTAGANAGSNVVVVLIDYLMVQDLEGKPLPPRTTIALTVPAKNSSGEESYSGPATVDGPAALFGHGKLSNVIMP
jgi:hypothetical protein